MKIRTTVRFRQVQKSTVGIGGILHNLLNLFLAEDTILNTVMGFNDNYTYRSYTEKISHLQSVRSGRVFTIAQQTAGTRMAGEGFRRWHYPKTFGVRRHQKLTSPSIRKLITLELAPDVHRIFRSQINCVGVASSI
jgi:hypothetical protein